MSAVDKAKIIAAINETDDERILFAINRLLQIEDDEIPEWHKQELDRRAEKLNKGEEKLYDWNDIKKEITDLD